ncbi:MAG: family 16 glycosylhydrolase [Bacteroidota bacterium]
MKKKLIFSLFSLFIFSYSFLFSQLKPHLNDPAFLHPGQKSWALVDSLSDDFDKGTFFDEEKWLTSPKTYTNWRGRIPGIFAREAIRVAEGNLQIRASKLRDSLSVMQNGTERFWTHQGGLVRSRKKAQPGYYFEARMKANQTFMSSTFWLINNAKEAGEACDQRVTELDIQECVGKIISTGEWAQNFDSSMHANTHDRRPKELDCSPNASKGNNSNLANGKVYEDFHVYGAWWKSPTEILFFLDGEHQFTVEPPSDFDLPMHIMMVVETYNWNPPHEGADGMDLAEPLRTTYYDWVRTWRLE